MKYLRTMALTIVFGCAYAQGVQAGDTIACTPANGTKGYRVCAVPGGRCALGDADEGPGGDDPICPGPKPAGGANINESAPIEFTADGTVTWAAPIVFRTPGYNILQLGASWAPVNATLSDSGKPTAKITVHTGTYVPQCVLWMPAYGITHEVGGTSYARVYDSGKYTGSLLPLGRELPADAKQRDASPQHGGAEVVWVADVPNVARA